MALTINPKLTKGSYDIRFLYEVLEGSRFSPGMIRVIMRYSRQGVNFGKGLRANDLVLADRLEQVPSDLEVQIVDGSYFQVFSSSEMPHPKERIWQQTSLTLRVPSIKVFESEIAPYFSRIG